MKRCQPRMMVYHKSTKARLESGEINITVVIHQAATQNYFRDGIRTQILYRRA